MKKQSASEDNRSLKTFFLYALVVFVVIVVALLIKLFYLVQQSKFDDKHHFTIALVRNEKVEKILGIDPSTNSVSLLDIKGEKISRSQLGETLAVAPNATIQITDDFPQENDFTKIMTDIAWRYSFVKSDITIYDISKLIFASKSVPLANKTTEQLQLPNKEILTDKVISDLFTDETLLSERVSIQIINASEVPGMGKRLERVLSNMGANVVAVSTAGTSEKTSKIQYFGEETYTLQRIKDLLHFSSSSLEKQTIAKIVITIGADSTSTKSF